MDSKAIAVTGLQSACGMFRKDLEALAEEAFTRRLGAKARTVADIVYEVNMVNDHIGMSVRGEKPFAWPEGGWITAPETFEAKEDVIRAYQSSTEKLIATFESLAHEEMERPMQTEHGETTPFERCRFVTLHLWYHSGQLNYIQTLLGDDAWHWN